MKKLFIILFLFSIINVLNAQNIHIAKAKVIENDTIIIINLPEHYVVSDRVFKNKREKRRYNRTVRYVKKVYPYAKLAGQKLRYYDDTLRKLENDRQRKKFMKKIEKEIKEEYEGELKKLTFTQGKILLKLLDRETNHTSYELLKDLRGAVSAVLWQGVGRVFGYNLKVEYDPEGEDKDIERIVQMIEMGIL